MVELTFFEPVSESFHLPTRCFDDSGFLRVSRRVQWFRVSDEGLLLRRVLVYIDALGAWLLHRRGIGFVPTLHTRRGWSDEFHRRHILVLSLTS